MFTKGRYCRVASSLRDMVVPKTLANFLDRKTQLYEQGADVRRIGQYVRNWWRWVRAGVEINVINVFTNSYITVDIHYYNGLVLCFRTLGSDACPVDSRTYKNMYRILCQDFWVWPITVIAELQRKYVDNFVVAVGLMIAHFVVFRTPRIQFLCRYLLEGDHKTTTVYAFGIP